MTHLVVLRFETTPLLMRVARKQTVAAAIVFGASEIQSKRIELAVGEALTNAHSHGYGGTPGPVELEILYSSGTPAPVELEIAYLRPWFAVTVRDQGHGFLSGPEFPEPPDPGTGNGYGLQVVKGLMDEAEFVQDTGPKGCGTKLRMAIFLQ